MASKKSAVAAAAALAVTTKPTATADDLAPPPAEPDEQLRPEAFEGLPIDVERLDVVNEGTATDRQRADLQAALTRLNSISFAATKDVYIIRELLFGDGHKTT